ncbi:peptidase S8/S53 domain-containing protein [Massariosphaeria phaeospora]|uniref:Peptidase S8/S53 domain-containing protein n=1 Tax=Massariosphaeria phaeospora TaxID=100035 RepID=A0A7C8I4F7_9PLEO|nr:peptidase S8/S53 domain-containing protein [Massariosphaeria phaeospora]
MRSLFTLLGAFAVGVHGIASIVGLDGAKVVADSYIVVLKKSVDQIRLNSHLTWVEGKRGVNKTSTFDLGDGVKGYTAQGSKAVVAELAKSEEIAYIEADQILALPEQPRTPRRLTARVVQTNAPWNLARISHRQPGSTDYVYSQISGTYVYVLDTGVRVSHHNFEGRATNGFSAVGGSFTDVNGHGTHIAGIAASQTYGVARTAGIVSVKIVGDDGSTTTSAVIAGINWAVRDVQAKSRVGKATALLAVGGGFSAALNSAVAAGSSAGLFFAVAAGGSNTNVSNSSPASEPSACTVGATTVNDARASSSNYGPLVDIWAPGQSIISLWNTLDTATNTLSGTSMAAAHIAGLGAYFLALEGPRGAVALCERLRQVATPNVLTGIPAGSPNLLAYNLSGL